MYMWIVWLWSVQALSVNAWWIFVKFCAVVRCPNWRYNLCIVVLPMCFWQFTKGEFSSLSLNGYLCYFDLKWFKRWISSLRAFIRIKKNGLRFWLSLNFAYCFQFHFTWNWKKRFYWEIVRKKQTEGFKDRILEINTG